MSYSFLPGLDLGDLVEGKLDRRLPAEDRHEHLELLGVGVDLVHGRRERRERAVHYGNGFADSKFHRGPGDLGLGRGLLRLGREQRRYLAERQRRGPARQANEAGDPGGVADHRPGFVGEVHPDQDVAGEHLLRDLLPLAALDLDHLVHRDLDLEDVVLHVQRLGPALQVGLHPVLVTGVGVDHVPLAGQLPQLGGELGDRVRLARAVRGRAVAVYGGARAVHGRASAVYGRAVTVYGRAVRRAFRHGGRVAGQPGVAGPAEFAGRAGLFGLVEFTDHVGLTNLAVSDRNFLRLIADTDSGLGHDCSSLRSCWRLRRHSAPAARYQTLFFPRHRSGGAPPGGPPRRRRGARLSRRPRTPAW